MSEKKDYLSALAEETAAKKPESYQEEHFEQVQKPKLKINPKIAIAGAITIIVASIAIYYFAFSPKIVVPDFVGKTMNDVGVWVKQEGLKASDMLPLEEYNFDVDEGKIISQTVNPDKKINEGTVITFIVSKGADPNEMISFPDLSSMDYSAINEWISTNKLQKVKVNTVYDNNIVKDAFISYDLKNVNENNFNRGTNLTISVSKGPQPVGTLTVEDFTKKDLSTVETFATTKKIVLDVVKVYSDDVLAGLVVSQSIKSGETMNQGETLTIRVSKGKAVTIPNFYGYTEDMLTAWVANKDNQLTFIKKEAYSNETTGKVISQSLKSGVNVDQGTVIELIISAGQPRLQITNSREWFGKDYLQLHSFLDAINAKGATIEFANWDGQQCNDEYPTQGSITSYNCQDKNGNKISCDGVLPLDGKVSYGISTGACTIAPTEAPTTNP